MNNKNIIVSEQTIIDLLEKATLLIPKEMSVFKYEIGLPKEIYEILLETNPERIYYKGYKVNIDNDIIGYGASMSMIAE